MKRALLDVSGIIWSGLYNGKDPDSIQYEDPETSKVTAIPTPGWGYDHAINATLRVMQELELTPKDLSLVIEGRQNKALRSARLPTYKFGRDHAAPAYEAFNACKEMYVKALLDLGASAVTQDGLEADDVMAALADKLQGERWIVSGDKDMAVMVGPGSRDKLTAEGRAAQAVSGVKPSDPSAWTGYIHHYRSGKIDENPFGVFPHDLITLYIALVGDSVDKIPGAKGFGEKAFEKLMFTFGFDGLYELDRLVREQRLKTLEEDVAELPVLRRIIDNAEDVYRSYYCAKLHIDKVDSAAKPLQWKAGRVVQREEITDERLTRWAGQTKIISAENYEKALPWLRRQFETSPFVALDIETSTCEESDAWVEALGKDEGKAPLDVMGSKLTSLQMTFGTNLQYTVYLPVDNVDEPGCTNLTVDQVRDAVALIPREKYIYVHNASFELVCIRNSWECDTATPYYGFLPNCLDTAVGCSYVNERVSQGLKPWSKLLLNYEQVTYEQVTTKTFLTPEWDGRGKVVRRWVETVETEGVEVEGPEHVTVRYKMNELTAAEVLGYGADDTICTAALALHNRVVMEFENTWDVYLEVEQFPAYLTAKAFIDGVPFNLETMLEQEQADKEKSAKAWKILRAYLISIGYDGTICPDFKVWDAPAIKSAHQIVLGRELKTLVRTPDKLLKLLRQETAEDDDAGQDFIAALAADMERGGTEVLMSKVKRQFKGEPTLNLGSPKQVKGLLYDRIKLPIRVINPLTDNEKENAELADAYWTFVKKRNGSNEAEVTPRMLEVLKAKAKTDDVAIDSALAFDRHLFDDATAEALKAFGEMKKCATRQSLFYNNYRNLRHWKTGRIHSSMRQSAAATRRYTSAHPNLQQTPKKGEGVKFRKNFVPHRGHSYICSADYSGQELRLGAEVSQDKNMLACYVGDDLKDPHAITAAGAMNLKWSEQELQELSARFSHDHRTAEGKYRLFVAMRSLGSKDPLGKAADDLRKSAKNVNFASVYGAKAPKIAETLLMPIQTAAALLDARASMFPGLITAAEKSEEFAKQTGYSLTLMGARRHLAGTIRSEERGEAQRAARQSWNFAIQGSAAEMSKLAMSALWLSGAPFTLDMKFIAPIHDEFVWSVSEKDAVETLRVVNECMTRRYSTMRVPILGSLSLGKNFCDQEECGDTFDEAGVLKAISKIREVEYV